MEDKEGKTEATINTKCVRCVEEGRICNECQEVNVNKV